MRVAFVVSERRRDMGAGRMAELELSMSMAEGWSVATEAAVVVLTCQFP